MHHSLQFLIDLTFNLSLVEEYSVFDLKRVESMLRLVLSTELLPKLSFMSLQPTCISLPEVEAEAKVTTSSIPKRPPLRRGRDIPFPAPPKRRRSDSSVSENTLLHGRYSTPVAAVVTPPPTPNTGSQEGELEQDQQPSIPRGRPLRRENRRTSRDSTSTSPHRSSRGSLLAGREGLLRVPPFPLPHRNSLSPDKPRPSQSPDTPTPTGSGLGLTTKERTMSKRVACIPPPLNLPPGYIQKMDENSDWEVGTTTTTAAAAGIVVTERVVLPEPELLQARKARRQRSCRPAPLLSGGYF